MSEVESYYRLINGKDESNIVHLDERNCSVNKSIVSDLNNLYLEAKNCGFELAIASGFRDYQRQLLIWNNKVDGVRPVLDLDSNPLDIKTLSRKELVFAIMRWSAIPGMSRHHWGTDIDVYDKASLPGDYQVKLIPEETLDGGVFAKLHTWLDHHLEQFNFYRPYEVDKGGVSPERWHLSHKSSSNFEKILTIDFAKSFIEKSEIKYKEILLNNISEVFERFIKA